MKTHKILSFLVMTLILGCPVYSTAQQSDPEIGIVEKLDKTIPMNLVFQDETGKTVKIGDLINKPTILAPVYFDCPGICVQLLSGVSDVVEKMDMEMGNDYDIITFSFNNEDTPEKALEKKNSVLGKTAKLHARSWHFLTGDSNSIYSLTNALGYRFKRAGNDFVHPASIIILSPGGKITRYLYGVNYLPFDTKLALIEAQRGQSRPSINRILDYCYSYDTEGLK
ncbi:MAG: SCO family protein [Syntrophothermus sp.]